MAKPLVTAKKPGPSWTVEYHDLDRDQESSIVVIGPALIDDALKEAKTSLDAVRQDWYSITMIELNRPVPDETDAELAPP
jgi:hypothetical protein